MKFLCVECDRVMAFAERQIPGDGTLAAVFTCPGCNREMAMLTNPMETQLVSSLGVHIGGRTVPEQPMEMTRSSLQDTRADVFVEPDPAASPVTRVDWHPEAVDRLGRVPSFVRGMVKRIYTDWAKENGVATMTPEVMDRARSELGLEGM
jgi:hypothetical protein